MVGEKKVGSMVDQRREKTERRPGLPFRPLRHVPSAWETRWAVHACRLLAPWSARQPPAWPVRGPESNHYGRGLGESGWVAENRVAVENNLDFPLCTV